jgi:6-phosphofructokinase 1
MGIPKTIDNDLIGTDHCPGYGSAAKYIATSVAEVCKDTHVYDVGTITVVEIMGRHAGWLTAASALASISCAPPDLIYLPEVDFELEKFVEDVSRIFKEKNKCLVAVSEGIHFADGTFVSEATTSATDGFGHAQLGGLAATLSGIIKHRTGSKVRGIELSLLQRCGAHLASQTDIDEAFLAGKYAVECAVKGETGKMVAFERDMSSGGYACKLTLQPLTAVANAEKKVPREWIIPEGNNVTNDFFDYALPLIQGENKRILDNGLPRFAHLKKVLVK